MSPWLRISAAMSQAYRPRKHPHGGSTHHAVENQAANEGGIRIGAPTGGSNILLGSPVLFDDCLVHECSVVKVSLCIREFHEERLLVGRRVFRLRFGVQSTAAHVLIGIETLGSIAFKTLCELSMSS